MKNTIIRCTICVSLALLLLSNNLASALGLEVYGGGMNNMTTTSSAPLIPDGEYYIALYGDRSLGLNVQYASTAQGTSRIVVDNLNGESNEVFLVRNHGGGLVSLHPKHVTSLAINALYGKDAIKGEDLTLWRYEESSDTASLWKVLANSDGSFSLQSAACQFVIDLNRGQHTVGNRLLLWERTGESICQSFFFTPVSTVNKIGYATYTGVNYKAQTSDARRIAVCDKAVKMSSILWTVPSGKSFPTWKSASGSYNVVTATDGTRSTSFLSGKQYQGIAYSMAGRTYDEEKWRALVDSGLNNMSTYYSGRTNTTAKGVDCSYLVCTALNAGCGTNINMNTASMLSSSKFKRINRSDMKPGDILLKNGHTMLYMGKTATGKYAVIEASASASRVVYNEYFASALSSYGSYRFTSLS